MSPRTPSSPYRYDRAAIRLVLETEGLEAARQRWPRNVVDVLARPMGLTRPYNFNPRHSVWNPEWTPLLGTKPDAVLAGELGIPHITVGVTRRKLGIPTFNRQRAAASRKAAFAAISDEELASSMDVVAAKYGVSIYDLQALRRRRSIRPQSKRGRRVRVSVADLRQVAIVAIRKAYPNATLEEIGAAVGCTRERVRQVIYFDQSAPEPQGSPYLAHEFWRHGSSTPLSSVGLGPEQPQSGQHVEQLVNGE